MAAFQNSLTYAGPGRPVPPLRYHICSKGLELNELMHQTIATMEETMVQNFTDEEKTQFSNLLRRAIDNLGGNPCKRKHKEEPET